MFLRLIGGIVGVSSLLATAVAAWLQYSAYRDEAFSREFGSLALAWSIIRESNGNRYNIGQAASLEYIIHNTVLTGGITLNDSTIQGLNVNQLRMPANLSSSSFCRTFINWSFMQDAVLYQSLFVHSTLMSVDITGANAAGSKFNRAKLWQLIARNASFVAADFSDAEFRGSDFTGADFTGANLRGVSSRPLMVGGRSPTPSEPSEIAFNPAVTEEEAQRITERNPWIVSDGSPAEERHTTFRDAKFQLADIRGADLTGSDISQSQVDTACADENTRLPSGVIVKTACVEDDVITRRRAALQRNYSEEPPAKPCLIETN